MKAVASAQEESPPGWSSWVGALMQARQTTLPKRLIAPGPDDAQLRDILAAASHAPDHDCKLPWRFVIVPASRRGALGEAFGRALIERDARASAEQLGQAREKALRAPLLLLAIARLCSEGDADVPDAERILSAGCAVQNMLLVATAHGFGSALTSGKALGSHPLRSLFELKPHEQALCFISIGTPTMRKPARLRPSPDEYVSELGGRP